MLYARRGLADAGLLPRLCRVTMMRAPARIWMRVIKTQKGREAISVALIDSGTGWVTEDGR